MVLRSEGGFPEAEYALFDPAEIELRAVELGAIREVGYRTTASEALERLAVFGITPQVSEDAAALLRGPAEKLYSRGAAVARAAPLLGPAELFDGYVYDVAAHAYEGLWIDHAAVARDLGVPAAGAILQAMGLAAMLDECAPDAELVLTTVHLMKERRAGERSYKRIGFNGVAQIGEALGNLSGAPSSREPRRARSVLELVQSLRDRPLLPERFTQIEQALASAKPPPRGPLADPEIWAIDAALAAGETEGMVARIEAVEKARGRQPATIYLRCRASLLLGTEPPRAIGERLAQLAISHSFPELEVLAAQAWLAAGESARALPFARSIAENPAAPSKLREIAEDIVAAVPHGSRRTLPPNEGAPHSVPPMPGPARSMPPSGAARQTVPPPFGAPLESDRSSNDFEWEDLPVPEPRPAVAPITQTARPPAPSLTPPPMPETSRVDVGQERHGSSIPPVLGFASHRAAAPPAQTKPPPATRRAGFVSAPPHGKPLMRGASQPAFRSDMPPVDIPRAPNLPRFEPRPAELAETLSLPPGLHGLIAPEDTVPATVAEARVQFTHLARELGREYRERFGVELWTDLRGIETMQTVLRDDFKDRTIANASEAIRVRRYGAFLSEVLARTLGAEWVDIAPSELGYWAMTVPPSTRVWPFGRVLRLIAMGTKERDLVSYYLELQARGRSHH
jgi:hypothetical protein